MALVDIHTIELAVLARWCIVTRVHKAIVYQHILFPLELLQRVDINCVVRNGRYFIAKGGHKLCGT